MNITVVDEVVPEQLELFEIRHAVQKDKGIEAAFREFHELNPHVYRNLKVLAHKVILAGRHKIGMKFLFERLRWEYAIATQHEEGSYRLNNNFTAYYARMLMDQEDELFNLFDLREIKAVGGKRRRIVTVGK